MKISPVSGMYQHSLSHTFQATFSTPFSSSPFVAICPVSSVCPGFFPFVVASPEAPL